MFIIELWHVSFFTAIIFNRHLFLKVFHAILCHFWHPEKNINWVILDEHADGEKKVIEVFLCDVLLSLMTLNFFFSAGNIDFHKVLFNFSWKITRWIEIICWLLSSLVINNFELFRTALSLINNYFLIRQNGSIGN